MPATVQLPSALHERLALLARRVRMQRLLRGLSVAVLSLALVGGVALLGDYLSGARLPALLREAALLLWLGLGGFLVARLIHRHRQPLDPAALAALIEQKHPELGERLS